MWGHWKSAANELTNQREREREMFKVLGVTEGGTPAAQMGKREDEE